MREGARTSAAGSGILIVEDEFLVSEMIADMVATLGYVAAGAANLTNVRHHLASGRFDCVLLDVRLGDELTIEAADVLIERGVPFAFVTGYTEPAEPRHAGIPALNKPFSINQLRLLLNRLIGPASVGEAQRKQAG